MYAFASDPVIPTVLAGVLIYVLGQVIQNFILKPIQDFRVILVAISHKLKFWCNVLTNFGLRPELHQQSRQDMRDLSSNLESRYVTIPFKRILAAIKAIPSPENVSLAAQKLIFLYNSGGEEGAGIQNHEAIEEIKQKLRLNL
ncbi:MAG: hypothetical protein HYZ63_03470 [Candidatus Andersenbacteria bacterium]|nr:hypothetical protein [Candidatus Andersenbacteria bacterium]